MDLRGALSRLPANLQRARLDPGYLPIWLLAQLKRWEHGTDSAASKTALRGITALLGLAHELHHRHGAPNAQLHWFSGEHARHASRHRNELLEGLAGKIQCSANGTKPHIGSLSPGCEICQNGDWGCNLINRKCTRDCWFCKRFHTMQVECDAETDGHVIASPSEHIHYIRSVGVKGVGFSGGEPLLVPDRLCNHIQAIRRDLGRSIYLWMYTNGDLVNPDILSRLRDVGLDEIRFNLSARGYDLSPVIVARDHLPTVTVEIPAIPEDFYRLQHLLVELQSIGVDYLNLHQLYVTPQNWASLSRRRYHVDFSTAMTIYESEICALKLLAHAHEKQVKLPINYCSHAYKSRFQSRGRRTRWARATVEGHQDITDAGFIRSLCVSDAKDKINELVRRMEAGSVRSTLWKLSSNKTAVHIHSSLIPHIDWSSASATLRYYDPNMIVKNRALGLIRENLEPDHRRIKIIRGLGPSDLQRLDSLAETASYEQLESGLPEVEPIGK